MNVTIKKEFQGESDEEISLHDLLCLNKGKEVDNNRQENEISVKSRKRKGDEEKHTENTCEKIKTDVKARLCKNCSYCSDHCPSSEDLKILKTRVVCVQCKEMGIRRSFKSEESLKKHFNDVHSENDDGEVKPTFPCPVCTNDTFPSKARLINHMASVHQTQIFICDVCQTSFKLKANYKKHMLSHNLKPKKPFKCDICDGTFVNLAGFEAHKKRFPGHHIKQTCGHCGVSFSKETHMKNHRCKTILLEEAAAKIAEEAEMRQSGQFETVVTGELAIDEEEEEEEEQVYTPVQVQVSEPLVFREVQDGRESEHLVIREVSGQIVPGTQVLQFEVSESDQTQQVYQVNVADWNMVAPFVIRDPNITRSQEQ